MAINVAKRANDKFEQQFCENNSSVSYYEQSIQIHKSRTINEYCQNGIVGVDYIIKFTEAKPTYWERPSLQTLQYVKNLGIECSENTPFVGIDVDHLHEHEKEQKVFNAIRDKYFNGAIASFNVNPNKYKLIFKITDNQETLAKYNLHDGLGVVGCEDKTIEFFGKSFKKQCIKVHGTYGKKTDDLTQEEKKQIFKTVVINGVDYGLIGYYTDHFSIIETSSDILCKFIDELLATKLFEVRSSNKKKEKEKTQEELINSYSILPETLKTKLSSIATAKKGQSNTTYLDNCYLYIQDCIKLNYSKQECIYFMQQALIERGIKNSKLNDFIKNVDAEYEKAKYFSGKTFNHAALAEELIKKYNLRKYNNNIYYWNDSVYQSNYERFIIGQVQELLPNLKKSQKEEVIYHIKHSRSVTNIKHADVNYIAFKNGILNIDTGELLPPSADVFITNIIPHNYNANAKDPNGFVEQCLNDWSCGDVDIANLLVELAGYCLYRNCKFKKAFILYGDKNNGKSSYIDLLVNMLGKDNITSHDLKDLTNQFYRVTLKDKLANIGDDIQKSYTDSSDFKKIVSGDMISAKASHQDPIDFKPYCKLIFSCNDIPRLTDNTGAVNDRLIIIPFNADFSNKPNKNLRQSLAKKDVIEYFIKIAVEELKNLLKNDCFTISTIVEKEKEKYRIDNDSILSFINEWKEQDGDYSRFNRESIDTIYNYYENFCNDNKLKPKGKIPFSRKVCSELNFKVQRKMIQRHNESYFINK